MNNLCFVIIRYNGLNEEVFHYIFDVIESIDSMKIKAIYNVKWNEKEKEDNLLSFYNHIKSKEIIEDIMEVNGLIMAALIIYDEKPCSPPNNESHPDFCDNWNSTHIKRAVRSKFGNVIHVSDSSILAYSEIDKLIGLDIGAVNKIIYGEGMNVKEVITCNNLAKIFNKISDGRKMLWTPKK